MSKRSILKFYSEHYIKFVLFLEFIDDSFKICTPNMHRSVNSDF